MDKQPKKKSKPPLGRQPNTRKKIQTRELLIEALVNGNTQTAPKGFFPLGVHTRFVADYENREVIHIDEMAGVIFSMKPEKIREAPFHETLSRHIIPEHLRTGAQMETEALHLFSKHRNKRVVVNVEYNILLSNREKKRLLIQVTAVTRDPNGLPGLLHGYVTDITHIISEGPPRMTVLVGNQVEKSIHRWPDVLISDPRLRLTQREISVLIHKRKGLRTKEIAHALQLREMTVYSIIRDIKKKTGMEIFPLIHLLEQNGSIGS